MEIVAQLPAVNAALNATAAVLILAGYRAIRRGDRVRHMRAMVAAALVSALFLVSYLTKTALMGTTRYGGMGLDRAVYFFVLGTHLTLAIAVVPLALATLWLAWRGQFRRHRRLARVTLPIWLYVSVTGVLVYFLLRPWY